MPPSRRALDAAEVPPIPAAQYIRISSDGQDLSPALQRGAISEYAADHAMRIMETYEDPGRSGLTIKSRQSMHRLIQDVASDSCTFKVVLVYDVSRWGRFFDTDESAYYEFHCRLHGAQPCTQKKVQPCSDGLYLRRSLVLIRSVEARNPARRFNTVPFMWSVK